MKFTSVIVLVLLAIQAPIQAHAATFVVDTTSNASLVACTAAANDCSLRGAIASANTAAGLDNINFNIPMSDAGCVAATGVCTITPGSTLVVFGGGAAVIDGTTQPGWQANTLTPTQGGLNTQLKIVLSGSVCPACSAINLAVAGSLVRGVAISGFTFGVIVEAGNVVIEGNFIGTNVTGSAAAANTTGIVLGSNPANVRIGGVLPAQRNLISGNSGIGMRLTGFGIQVLGNLIGTNAAGTTAIPNDSGVGLVGIDPFQYRYLIGDGTPAGRNVISGNSFAGIRTQGSSGNEIGTMSDSRIQGNYIGTDVTGEMPLGNGQAGIRQTLTILTGDSNRAVLIGGLLAGQGNRIRFNGGAGIVIPVNRERTSILGNQISANAGLGVSLGATARLANDPGDGDTAAAGANFGQNFPEISAFSVTGSTLDLIYRVDSAIANSSYPLRVEFFKADGDEGRDLIGVDSYTAAQAQMVKGISLAIPAGISLSADDVIVATATDAAVTAIGADAVGNSSEFSFSPLTFTIETPVPSACVLSGPRIFCDGFDGSPLRSIEVTVRALSTVFKPNGTVRLSDNRGASCTLTLRPISTPLTSAGSCVLGGSGAPGPITITAVYDTFNGAFGSATGGNITVIQNFTL